MDLGTGLALFGSTKLVERFAGPLMDYFGNEIADFAKSLRGRNLKRILDVTERRIDDIDNPKKSFPIRVVREVVNNGTYHEDAIAAEYFGGVLASSFTDNPRDDRGASICKLIESLSSYELRAHYILYSVIRRVYEGEALSLQLGTDIRRTETAISERQFVDAMGIDTDPQRGAVMTHIFPGLGNKGLIGSGFAAGTAENVANWAANTGAFERVVAFTPSHAGAELFLWAHGLGNIQPVRFLDAGLDISLESSIVLPRDVKRRFPAKTSDNTGSKG